MTLSPSRPLTFEEKHREIAQAAKSLQRALQAALSEVLVGEPGSRSLGRRLGIDKMLASQALRITAASDAPDILSVLPGERGTRTLIEGFQRAGASEATVATIERAVADLQRAFRQVNASPLQVSALAAGARDSTVHDRHLAKMQKLHFESGVALRGEVADAFVVAWFVVPSRRDPSLVSLASLDMTVGRRTTRWLGPRIVHRGISVDPNAEAGEWSAVDRMRGNPIPSLVASASTPDLGPGIVEAMKGPTGTLVLADPDAHPSRELTLTFAELLEAAGPFHATPTQRTGELSSQVPIPIRQLWFDVLLDRTLPPIEPTAALFFSATLGIEYGEFADLRRFYGKIDAGFMSTTALPASSKVDPQLHAQMLAHGAAMVDRPLDAFRCFRMHIAYPPSPTRAVVRWNLPAADQG